MSYHAFIYVPDGTPFVRQKLAKLIFACNGMSVGSNAINLLVDKIDKYLKKCFLECEIKRLDSGRNGDIQVVFFSREYNTVLRLFICKDDEHFDLGFDLDELIDGEVEEHREQYERFERLFAWEGF